MKYYRVNLVLVNPEYTSQMCSSCGFIHKKSRSGEKFRCLECNFELDADINGAINILNRYLSRESTVPYNTKTLM